MSDLTTLSTENVMSDDLPLSERIGGLYAVAHTLREYGLTEGADDVEFCARRLDAMRWREAISPPEDREKVLLKHQVLGWGEGWYIAEDRIWFFIDHRCAFDHILSWLPLPTYQPEREVRG